MWWVLTFGVALVLSGPALAAETVISVAASDCATLVRHASAEDVSFKPGVDSRGRKVAPANIGGGAQIELPTRFEIPITVDLGDRLGVPPRGDADYIARFPVGTVVATADGRVSFNGVELTDRDTAELAARCQRVE